jgi:hypothetical protein
MTDASWKMGVSKGRITLRPSSPLPGAAISPPSDISLWEVATLVSLGRLA